MHATIQLIRSILRRGALTLPALLSWSILIVLAAGAGVALGPRGAMSEELQIVARVNEEPVTRAELKRMLDAPATRLELQQKLGVQEPGTEELGRLSMQKLINTRLILQEAGRRGYTVTEQEIDEALIAMRRRSKDLRSFGVWLKEQGLDDTSLFESIRTEILMDRVRKTLVEGIRISEEQVREYYEAHKEDMKKAGEVRLRIIAVKDRAAADEIMAALHKGANFARLARERSVGMRAAKGGDTGWVDSASLPPPLLKAVDTLEIGQAGGPLPGGDELLIVGLVGKRPPQTKSMAEAQPEIERHLLSAKREEVYKAWLAEQERKSKIEVFLQPG